MRDDLESTCRIDPDSTLIARVASSRVDELRHALVVCDRDGQRRRVALGNGDFRVGRLPGNDLVLDDSEISRLHCVLTVTPDGTMLRDAGSTNGTWLSGHRIEDVASVASGAVFRVGPFLLHYQRGDSGEMAHAAEVDRELERAHAYVKALLPPPILEGPVRADWRFVPSGHVGGDAFGFRWLDDQRFALFMMDVAGHGTGSALLAASVMNLLRQRATVATVAEITPASVLTELNASFQMEDQGGLFFCAWYGLFNRRTRQLDHAAAGHHPAYLLADAAAPLPLGTRNPPIGMLPSPVFHAGSVAVPPGSRVVLFSDGAFETTGHDGDQRRLADFEPVLSAPTQPGVSEPERLLRAARAAMRPGPFDDDVSILVAEFD